MRIFCHFHPSQPAYWSCNHCAESFCNSCAVRHQHNIYGATQEVALCPTCKMQMTFLGAANIVDPFWKRLPQIFAYPFSLWPLVFMACVAIGGWLVSMLGFFQFFLSILLWGVTIKYAFSALRYTASGKLSPPPINEETVSQDFGVVFKQVVLYIIVGAIAFWVAVNVGRFAAMIIVVLAQLFLPAMLILLASTNSLLAAINPMLFGPLVFRVGSGYLLMCAFLLLLLSAPAVVNQYAIKVLPTGLFIIIAKFVESYYLIMAYHLMGYVILQYHDKIGYEVDYNDFAEPQEQAEIPVMDPEENLLNQVEMLIKDGKAQEALERIAQWGPITGLALSQRYFSLLNLNKRDDEMLKQGPDHLKRLIEANKRAEAYEAYQLLLKKDPSFLPPPEVMFKMGAWLSETGKPEKAIKAYSQFIKTYPDDPLIPKVYFYAARVYNDGLMKPEKARKILHGLIKKYPDHSITPQAKRYLAHSKGEV